MADREKGRKVMEIKREGRGMADREKGRKVMEIKREGRGMTDREKGRYKRVEKICGYYWRYVRH